jgi:hypothetical protein
MLKKILNFEISDAKIERLIDETTALCSFRIITEGQNRHSLPISLEAIKDAAERTLRGKPIVASYSKWDKDLESHKRPEDSEAIGYFIENQDFKYEIVENGLRALFAKGILWKTYAPNQVGSLFSANNHTKGVSMEIKINSLVDENDESKGIASFSFLSVCILGDRYSPASPLAHVKLLTFEAMKDKYESLLFESKYKVDFSLENAFMEDTEYRNEGRSLYGKMLGEPNEKQLINCAYLSFEEGYRDSPSTKLKFPVGKWRGNTLCLSKSGLQLANSKLKSLGIKSGSVIDKLKEYYSILGLSIEGFSTEIEKEEDKLDEKVMMEQDENKEEKMAIEEEKKEEVKEEPKEEKMAVEEEKKEEEPKEKEEDFGCGKLEYEAKIAEYEKELFELRKFKSDREEQDKKFELEKLFSQVGDSLSKDQLEEFRSRSETIKFSDVPAFSNEVKAATFDVVKKVNSEDNIKRMATTIPVQEKKKNPFW